MALAGNGETTTFGDQKPIEPWFGYERFSSTLGAYPVEVVKAPITWDERHVERLLATCETDGLVPTLNATIDDGNLELAQLQIFSPTLHQRLAMSRNLGWEDAAGLVSSASRAVDNGHLLGLRHGGLSPKSVAITSDAVSIQGMGLGRGGELSEDLQSWAAPEVLAGETPGVRSDVFSLGKILEKSLASAKGASPSALAGVAAIATSPNFMDRYPTAAAFSDAIDDAAGMSIAKYDLAKFGAAAVSGVPAGLPVSVGLFSDDTFIDLTDSEPANEEPDDGIAIVPDAQPVVEPAWTNAAAAETTKKKGGWLPLVGLLGLGALVVAGALLVGSGDEDSAATTVATTTAPTTEAPDTTAAPTTVAPTTAAPTTVAPTTAAPTTEASTTTAAPTTEAPTTEAPNANTGESPVEVVHGIPDASYDVYSNGELLVAGFAPETIAGPVDLGAGSQSIEVFEAIDDPPADSADRSDDAAVSSELELAPDQPTSIAAHLDASGNPVLSAFADNRLPVPAGKSRLNLRHLAAAGPVQILIDGEPVGSAISNGDDVEVEVDAGEHDVSLVDAEGNEVFAARLDAAEGSATTVSAVTGSDGQVLAIVQTATGLDTAPGEVPTGDSGLKSDSLTGISLLAIALLVFGLVVLSGVAGATWQRQRTPNA